MPFKTVLCALHWKNNKEFGIRFEQEEGTFYLRNIWTKRKCCFPPNSNNREVSSLSFQVFFNDDFNESPLDNVLVIKIKRILLISDFPQGNAEEAKYPSNDLHLEQRKVAGDTGSET